jgi:hypothetical protein
MYNITSKRKNEENTNKEEKEIRGARKKKQGIKQGIR